MPDVHPGDLVQRPGMLSMCAGDFVEVYSEPHQAGSFDCVATCFFLDTAHNILQYMQIIKHILKVRQGNRVSVWLRASCGQDRCATSSSLDLGFDQSLVALCSWSAFGYRGSHCNA